MNYYAISKDEAFFNKKGIRILNKDGSLSLIHSREAFDKAEKLVRIKRTDAEVISDRLMDLADSMNLAYTPESELWAEAARFHTISDDLRHVKGLITGDSEALRRLGEGPLEQTMIECIDEAIKHLDASFRHTLGVPQDDLYPNE